MAISSTWSGRIEGRLLSTTRALQPSSLLQLSSFVPFCPSSSSSDPHHFDSFVPLTSTHLIPLSSSPFFDDSSFQRTSPASSKLNSYDSRSLSSLLPLLLHLPRPPSPSPHHPPNPSFANVSLPFPLLISLLRGCPLNTSPSPPRPLSRPLSEG